MFICDLLRAIEDGLDVYIIPINEAEWYDEHYNGGAYGSWRGDYFDALITFNDDYKGKYEEYVPFKTLKPILEDLISGRLFEGYKGGLYSFNKNTPIHFNWGESMHSDIPLIEFVREEDKEKFKKYFYQYF